MTAEYDGIGKRKFWTFHSPARSDCTTLIPALTEGQRVYFMCDDGGVVSTNDFGETWVVERQLEIVKMQATFNSLIDEFTKRAEEEAQQEAREQSGSNGESTL